MRVIELLLGGTRGASAECARRASRKSKKEDVT
jgi:hypothetical protein